MLKTQGPTPPKSVGPNFEGLVGPKEPKVVGPKARGVGVTHTASPTAKHKCLAVGVAVCRNPSGVWWQAGWQGVYVYVE